MPTNITKRQKEVMNFITEYLDENGYAPSLQEIADHIDVSSLSTVHEHLNNLKEKGYLKKQEHHPRSIVPLQSSDDTTAEVELKGVVTAGQPIEAIEDPEPVEVPSSMVSHNGTYFALQVRGNSMIDEGISDGDIVIIKKQVTVEDGTAAVAFLPEENKATIKKVYAEEDRWRLQPANEDMEPIFSDNIQIKGRVTGIIRNFYSRDE